jgi:hypothetical protein
MSRTILYRGETTTCSVVFEVSLVFRHESTNSWSPGLVGVSVREPEVARSPDHAPLPAQLLAWRAAQVSTVLSPMRKLAGVAFIVTATVPACDMAIRDASSLIT